MVVLKYFWVCILCLRWFCHFNQFSLRIANVLFSSFPDRLWLMYLINLPSSSFFKKNLMWNSKKKKKIHQKEFSLCCILELRKFCPNDTGRNMVWPPPQIRVPEYGVIQEIPLHLHLSPWIISHEFCTHISLCSQGACEESKNLFRTRAYLFTMDTMSSALSLCVDGAMRVEFIFSYHRSPHFYFFQSLATL